MDAISYSYADKQAKRIGKFINDLDSTSGVVTVPKVIASGENITIPAGRVAVMPNVRVDGTLNVQGDVFVPAGATYSSANIISDIITTTGGSVSTPSYSFASDTDTGLSNPAANTVAISTGGAERVRIDANGNVGVGVTPSASNKLQVKSGTNRNIGIADQVTISGATTLEAIDDTRGSNIPLEIRGSSVSITRPTGTTMTLDSAGNVGIGTSNPLGFVNQGTAIVGANAGTQFYAGSSSSGISIGGYVGAVYLQSNSNNDLIVGTSTSNALSFRTAGTERVRVDASGNVGIGKSPSLKLDTEGNGRFLQMTQDTTGAVIIREDAAGTNGGVLQFVNNTNATQRGSIKVRPDLGWEFNTNNSIFMKISTAYDLLLTSGTGGLGYGTGAGGTVTQATSKSTAVTLNKPTGKITMNNASLAAGASVSFVFYNSLVSINDGLILNVLDDGTTSAPYGYKVTYSTGPTYFWITVKNDTAGALAEAINIKYSIIKGAVA